MKYDIFNKIQQFSHLQNCAVPYHLILNKFRIDKLEFDNYLEELKNEGKINIDKLHDSIVFYVK